MSELYNNDYWFLLESNQELIKLLLRDRTTKKTVIWATKSYEQYGKGFTFSDCVSPNLFKDEESRLCKPIKPQYKKNEKTKNNRAKDNAEVFTPCWICNSQNNLIDNEWFGIDNVFNYETGETWKNNNNKIGFPDGKDWKQYIAEVRLEVACGEAPYIVSRYDSVTGKYLDINNRIGILDRKFRVLNENCKDSEWVEQSFNILKSVYGYEFQGDNLIIARENVLFSYIDYYIKKFEKYPDNQILRDAIDIITWNFWQMDGLKCVIPNSCKNQRIERYNLFGEIEVEKVLCPGCQRELIKRHNGIYSKIMDWSTNKPQKFVNLLK